MTTINFCECGRVMPCKYKDHEEFDIKRFAKKHFKVLKKRKGGYSAQREEQGEFQPGQGR